MDHNNPAYHTPWVWSDESDCHITNDQRWFSDFIEYRSHVVVTSSDGRATKVEVHGIGSVELNVKSKAEKNRSKRITLYNVLYIPVLATNIIGFPILDDYIVDEENNTLVDFMDGAKKGLLYQHGDYRKLRLKHTSNARSGEDSSKLFVPTATWSKEEKTKIEEAYQAARNGGMSREAALRTAPRNAFSGDTTVLAGGARDPGVVQDGSLASTENPGADCKDSATSEEGEFEARPGSEPSEDRESEEIGELEAYKTVLAGWEAFAVGHGGDGRGA